MQTASAVQVTIRSFGVWNMGLGLISAIAMSVVAAWLVTCDDDLLNWSCIPLIGTTLLGVYGVKDLVRWRPLVLRWDTQRWRVTDLSLAASEIEVSQLRVVLDLGGWMLLKFQADGLQRGPRGGWIPVQRQGLELQWQSLRCAVYASGTGLARSAALDRQVPRG